MRRNGLTPDEMIGESPELRLVGIANAFRYAVDNPQRYAGFLTAAGMLEGPGFTNAQAEALPEDLRDLPAIRTASTPTTASA
jgi:hypothetical protein